MEGTVFTASLEGMKHVKSPEGEMLTKPFLEVCKLILPVIGPDKKLADYSYADWICILLSQSITAAFSRFPKIVLILENIHNYKFGASMALVKSDIGGNVTRLENKYLSNPTEFNHLYSMVKEEIAAKTTKASSSCTNGLLWLTSFPLNWKHLAANERFNVHNVHSTSIREELVAMKLAPDRKKFMDVISGSGDVNADMEKFCSTFSPFLEENHKFLASVGLDDMKLHD
ncbi:hypothetical protein JRO89_XS03G0090500 [Xanthoceras sorbifolium]|uniref:Glycolipid transfer protein domain-containing protein n=1 Tax=Xanthoceras sorbifolium TaxID=99658 RepID=A0ABQ8I9V6_9ROSI|nr:hypothetical protein JRO89_XS03G0090500 [Xanthoceras sorbifolium]